MVIVSRGVRTRFFACAVLSTLALDASRASRLVAQAPYYPAAGDSWQHRTPEQVGLNAKAVQDAVAIALAAESTAPRDLLENHRNSFGREPFGEAIGPFRSPRGGAAGLIVKKGYIVAEWGDPDRVDQTYSVTKSFVTTTVGLAYDRKMIKDLKDPVYKYMVPIVAFNAFDVIEPFESEHNRKITWDHLLRQTSEWQGTLWGKPDWADRPRGDIEQWKVRARPEPGTVYTYNDVRVNLMALASLTLWRRPLPQVLKEYVMDPIGASHSWRWYGYDNSWVVLDGALVQSVAGGAHWGGGLIINSRDMARFGLLTLRKGKWADKQILSEEWIRMATTPGVNTGYGFANFFLNTARRGMPSAPEQAFWHLGNGNNVIFVDPVNDLVIVARWMTNLRAMDGMVKLLLESR